MPLTGIAAFVVLYGCSGVQFCATPVAKKVVPARELLINASLDRVTDGRCEGWAPYQAGYSVDTMPDRNQVAACINATDKEQRGLSQALTFDRSTLYPLTISCWSKAADVTGPPSADYSLYVDVLYQDKTSLWGQVAAFSCGTHDWEYRQLRILPDRPVRQVLVYAMFRNRLGKAWFDQISVKSFPDEPRSVVFEGAAIASDSLGHDRLCTAPEIHIRDVAANSDVYKISIQEAIKGYTEIPELQLAVTVVEKAAVDGYRQTDIKVRDLAKRDLALALYYVLPVEAADLRWYDNVRQSRAIRRGEVYKNVTASGVGAQGVTSRHPLACIAGPKGAHNLIVPEPRICHFAYDDRVGEFYAAFDIALSQDTRKPGEASVTVCDAVTDGAWGMRSTLQSFYKMLPRYYDPSRILKRQGNWMPFVAISSVQQPEDFGFAVHEGDNDVRWDNDHGVGAYVYAEPMTWWLPLPPEVPRTYEAVMNLLEGYRSDPKSPHHDRAWAMEQSGVFEQDGRFRIDLLKAPWCDGVVFGHSADPDIAESDSHLNLAHLLLRDVEKSMQKAETQGGLAGVYLDSLEGWSRLNNHRREHFRAADLPLTFDVNSLRPVIINAFATQEYVTWMSQWVRAKGKLLMANNVPVNFPYLACPLDLMGTETNWQQDGRFAPPDADDLYLKRMMSWRKPYMFLMNTRFETWTAQMTERYMQICLFYGMFPGFFSEDAMNKCYFTTPAWYNRDRPLFRKYMPLIQRIAQAGWEPITLAQCDADDVWLERWGASPSSGLYFTVMNTSQEKRHVTVTCDASLGEDYVFQSVLTGASLGRCPTGELDLEPGSVEVIQATHGHIYEMNSPVK